MVDLRLGPWGNDSLGRGDRNQAKRYTTWEEMRLWGLGGLAFGYYPTSSRYVKGETF